MKESERIEQLVVAHVARRRAELCVGFDDLLDGVKKISLCGNLAPWADGKHPCLSTDAVDIST